MNTLLNTRLKTVLIPFFRTVQLLLVLSVLSCVSAQKSALSLPPRQLVLGLDGVGYQTMSRLYEGGYFREFFPPSPMVASFPSISDPNWALLMDAPLPESFTKAYFNSKRVTSTGVGAPEGSLLNHLTSPPAYEAGFDFKAEGAFQHLAIMTWTQTSALVWLDKLEKQILESKDKETYFAFIMNTDILAHVQGEKGLLEFLSHVDKQLRRIKQRILEKHGFELEITIVSDHGNHWVKPKDIDFESVLKSGGWEWQDTLAKPKDYGYVAPEIIAFAAFYTLPGQEESFAKRLSYIKDIEVSAFLSGPNQIDFYNDKERNQVRITVDPKTQTVSYRVLKGHDPLDQERFFKNKSIRWDDYFQESYTHQYPYAAVRIWEGFHTNSKSSASVLASPALGHVFSNRTLQMITAVRGLQGMHGSLNTEESLGVFMRTQTQTGPIRPQDFRKQIDLTLSKKNLLKLH